ncbi:DUF5949 family protein [Streptomyces sp. NPDC060194]|uniref:DUF5949 family protein n=1 Tax=Streptomyces sp. NPDC060194 TaxID=3347069 RepID=UPI003659F423
MTSTPLASADIQASPLGTVSVIPWASDPASDQPSVPFLMVYPLGDGREGAEGSTAAMTALLTGLGLTLGDRLIALAEQPRIAVSLLVEAGQAALTLGAMKVQAAVPPEWEQAAKAAAEVYLICAVRPWPEAVPGRPVDEQTLRAFVGDSEMLSSSAHCLLPVRSLR